MIFLLVLLVGLYISGAFNGGALQVVTVMNCYMHYGCFFDGSVKNKDIWSFAVDNSISCCGLFMVRFMSSLNQLVACICNALSVFPLIGHT